MKPNALAGLQEKAEKFYAMKENRTSKSAASGGSKKDAAKAAGAGSKKKAAPRKRIIQEGKFNLFSIVA